MTEGPAARGKRAALIAFLLVLAVPAVTLLLAPRTLDRLREEWRLYKLEDPARRHDYAVVLGSMASRRAPGAILRLSGGGEEALQLLEGYFYGLQFHRTEEPMEDLMRDLEHAETGIRCRAAMLLGFQHQTAAVPVLTQARRGDDPVLAAVARRVLAMIEQVPGCGLPDRTTGP